MGFGYPIILDLGGVDVVVVGGGRIARRKVETLLAAGATIRVVAPSIDPWIQDAAVTTVLREFRPDDLDGARLVFTATNDPAVNSTVAAEATRRNLWVNSADDPANCTFTLPAVARHGSVTLAVSTGGSSPALASHLRDEVATWLQAIGAADAAANLSAQRAELRARGLSTESIDWTERVRAALTAPPDGV